MGLLETVMQSDAQFGFNDTDVFAEAVTYTDVDGNTRSINATVFRNPPRPLPEQADQEISRRIEIWVENNVTRGIVDTELDMGGDTITVADVLGETAEKHVIVQILEQDAAMLKLQLR